MDEERANKSDGRVGRIGDIAVHVRKLHPDYRIETYDGSKTPTGLIAVFRVIPVTPGRPLFEARCEGPPERADLDIDRIDPDTGQRWKTGFAGHHTVETTDATSHHRYEVKIDVRSVGRVLDAVCTFTVARHISLHIAGEGKVTCEIVVIRGTPQA